MEYREIAGQILENVGGSENVISVTHCFTRLRFKLRDNALIKGKKIATLEKVAGEQLQSGQYQVIIGNDVSLVYNELTKMVDIQSENDVSENKEKIIDRILGLISGVFTPILPAIIGAGMLKALIAVLNSFQLLNPEGGMALLLNIISDAPFYFLPLLLAVSAARKFKTNEFLAVTLAAVLVYPTFIGMFELGASKNIYLGLFPIPIVNYSSSVIPILLGTYFLAMVYQFINKIIPKLFSLILVPMLTLLIVVPVTLGVLGPIGYYIGNYLEKGINWLFANTGPLAGLVFGALMPVITISGMHYAFFPTAIQSLGTLGYDIMLLPIAFINNVAQAGATLAVGLKVREKRMKSLAASTGVSALFGITEPAMYGVTIKLKKPFYIAMLASGLAGGFASMFGMKAFGFAAPGILSLPVYNKEGTNNLLISLIALSASFIIAFVLTYLFGVNYQETEKTSNTDKNKLSSIVYSPVKGRVVDIKSLSDKVFADEIVGKGVAIYSEDGKVYAPFDGTVSLLLDSKHAIGLTSNDGIELLIHIGLDTVNLGGEGFASTFKAGDKIKKGDLLIQFNTEELTTKGYDMAVCTVITNSKDYTDIIKTNQATIDLDDKCLLVIK